MPTPEEAKPEFEFDIQPNLRLKRLMDEMGYTQAEIAERISRHFTTVNKYFKPSPRPIPEAILMLLQARLGFSRKYIEYGIEPRFVKPELFILFAEVPYIMPDLRTTFGGLDNLPAGFPTYRLYGTAEREAQGAVVVEITGRDLMTDQLKPGTKVLGHRLDPAAWEHFTGVVGVLYHPNKFEVKRITQNTLPTSDTLTLHADSPKGGSITLARSVLVELYNLHTIVYSPVE